MGHKAIWKGHPMRLELTRGGLLAELANHYTTRGAYEHMFMSQNFIRKFIYELWIALYWKEFEYLLDFWHKEKRKKYI